MIAIIVFIVAALFIFRQANVNGYNPLRCVIGAIAAFFGIQIIVRVLFFLAILFFQSSPEGLAQLNEIAPTVDIISFVLSLIALLLIMWQVSQKNEDLPVTPQSNL